MELFSPNFTLALAAQRDANEFRIRQVAVGPRVKLQICSTSLYGLYILVKLISTHFSHIFQLIKILLQIKEKLPIILSQIFNVAKVDSAAITRVVCVALRLFNFSSFDVMYRKVDKKIIPTFRDLVP